jgi:hypothetical protein
MKSENSKTAEKSPLLDAENIDSRKNLLYDNKKSISLERMKPNENCNLRLRQSGSGCGMRHPAESGYGTVWRIHPGAIQGQKSRWMWIPSIR